MDHATYPGWTGPQTTGGHAESFQLLSQRLKQYFTEKKIPEAEQTAHILLVRVGKEGLGRFSSWALPEEQQTPATILGRFKEHLEPQCRKFQDCWTKADGGIPTGSGLWIAGRLCQPMQVCRCWNAPSLQTNACWSWSSPAAEISTSTEKNLLSQGPGFSLEEALRLGRTYEAKASHIQ